MALTKTAQEKLLKALKVSDAAIAELMKDGEFDLDLPAGVHVMNDTELADLKKNVKTGHEQAYAEIWGKEMNKKHDLGLSVTDAKDPDKVEAAIKAKAVKDAGIAPDKKILELETSLKNLQEKEIPAKDKEVTEWKAKYNERVEYDEYAKLIPDNANKFLTRDEHINRVKSIYQLGDNGTIIDRATGAVLKDNLEKPVGRADAVSKKYKETEGWLQPGGDGNKNSFHHSTNGSSGGTGGKKLFDHDSALEGLSAKYDMNNPEQRMMAMSELTVMQVNHNKP